MWERAYRFITRCPHSMNVCFSISSPSISIFAADRTKIIEIAQVFNGCLLPFFSLCLLVCLNDQRFMHSSPQVSSLTWLLSWLNIFGLKKSWIFLEGKSNTYGKDKLFQYSLHFSQCKCRTFWMYLEPHPCLLCGCKLQNQTFKEAKRTPSVAGKNLII